MPFFTTSPIETSSWYYEYIKIMTSGTHFTSSKVYVYTRVRDRTNFYPNDIYSYRWLCLLTPTVSNILSLNLHGIVWYVLRHRKIQRISILSMNMNLYYYWPVCFAVYTLTNEFSSDIIRKYYDFLCERKCRQAVESSNGLEHLVWTERVSKWI